MSALTAAVPSVGTECLWIIRVEMCGMVLKVVITDAAMATTSAGCGVAKAATLELVAVRI